MGIESRHERRRTVHRRRGAALFVALFAATAVAVLATCLLQFAGASQRRQLASADLKRAFYLADAGIAEAYAGLAVGKTGNVGSEAAPARLGTGVFWVQATELDAEHVRLESIGMAGRARATVEMTVERGDDSVATLGLFAARPFVIVPGTTIGGCDSSESPPDPTGGGPRASPRGRVGSNDELVLQGAPQKPTVVDADLVPGPGHGATIGRHVTHTGSIAPRAAAASLPAVEPPFAPTGTGIDLRGPDTLVVQPGDVGFAYLDLADGAHAIVQGPCKLVVGRLTVADGATLEFETDDGVVDVWAADSLQIADGASVVCRSTDSSRLTIQLASDAAAHFGASGPFHGVLYAPEARVTIGAAADVNGGLIADEVVLTAGAKLRFDAHLDEATALETLPKLLVWRILELESQVQGAHGADPFQILGVDPALLPSPAKAHADVELLVVYQDLAGFTRTFDGMESAFDWNAVESVQQIERSGKAVGYRPSHVDELAALAPKASSAAHAVLGQVPALAGSALRDALLAIAPLQPAELLEVLDNHARLRSGDLEKVLAPHYPLEESVLKAALGVPKSMSSSDWRDALVGSSPLPSAVLAQVLLGAVPLAPIDLSAVLAVQ